MYIFLTTNQKSRRMRVRHKNIAISLDQMTISENIKNKYSAAISSLNGVLDDLEAEITSKNADLLSEVDKLKSENHVLSTKYGEAKAKLDKIEGQLQETVDQLSTISKGQQKDVDAMKLLDIYLVLMGDVFNSAAHVKLLFIMHGQKETYTLEELTKATGMSGIQVRKAVFELRNSNIVTYNDDTTETKLVTRFMD